MNILWTIFEISINFFQGWMYLFFLNRQLTRKPSLSKQILLFSKYVTILAVAAFYTLHQYLALPFTDSFVYVITFVYSIYAFSDKWYMKLIWNTILGVVLVAIATLISQLFINIAGISWDIIMTPSPLRLGFVLCSNFTLFVTYYSISIVKYPHGKLSWFSLFIFLILNLILLITLEMQYSLSWHPNIPQFPVLVTIFCLLFVIAGLLAMFELLSCTAQKQTELERRIETSSIVETHYAEIRSMYQNILKYEHDMKHHLNILKQMIENEKIDESNLYLDELHKITLPIRYVTGCIAIDALLSVKSAYMQQFNIELDYSPYPLNDLPMKTAVFCAIIGNLLDNAIEATQRISDIKKHTIELSFSRTRDMFYITCKNEINKDTIKRRGNEFLSSKHKHRTGYGIPSIRDSVEQAEGHSDFRIHNNLFIVEIVIPFKREVIRS